MAPTDAERDAFGARMRDALEVIGIDGAVYDPDAFAVTTPHGRAHLAGLWQATRSVSPRDQALLEAHWRVDVASVPIPSDAPDDARSHLRVRATPRALHTRLALEGLLLERPYQPTGRQLGTTTVLEVVYAAVGFRPAAVLPAQLADWGLTPGASYDEAIARRLADGAPYVARGAGWGTMGPASGLAALALLWSDAAARPAARAATGLDLERPVFVPLRDDTVFAYDPDVPGASDAVAASVARIVDDAPADHRWLGVDGLRPADGSIDVVPLPVPQRVRDQVRLAHHQLAYRGSGTFGLLEAAYGGVQGDLQRGERGLRAVPRGLPALLGEAATVVNAAGEEVPFAAVVEAGGTLVEGLWPPVWLVEAPI